MTGWVRLLLLALSAGLLLAIAAVVWLLLFPPLAPISPDVPVASSSPPVQPTPTSVEAPPTVPPVAPGAPITLTVGGNAQVVNTGQCLNVREMPGLQGSAVDCLADNTKLRITGGPAQADGVTWWQVSRQSVPSQGWVSGQYLQPIAP